MHKSQHTKPPKLRFKPGQFVRRKSDDQLFCIRVIYRTIDDPHEWKYQLEERLNTDNPSTKLSELVAKQVSERSINIDACIVVYNPVKSGYGHIPGTEDFYHYGDTITVSNKILLNDYVLADVPSHP